MDNQTPSRFASTEAKSKLLAAMREYLADKDGPLRLERLASRVAGQPWNLMSYADRAIIAGAVARCGFTSPIWPHWIRSEGAPPEGPHPGWLKRAAA